MSGTKEGGAKAAATNKEKYGRSFYQEIGRKGGQRGHTGGFASNPELARRAGAKGGRKSVRGASLADMIFDPNTEKIQDLYDRGYSIPEIAEVLDVSAESLRKWAKYAIEGYGKEWKK